METEERLGLENCKHTARGYAQAHAYYLGKDHCIFPERDYKSLPMKETPFLIAPIRTCSDSRATIALENDLSQPIRMNLPGILAPYCA